MSENRGAVAVTGASGFLGRHTTEKLLSLGYRVVSLGRTDPRIPGVEHTSSGDWSIPHLKAFFSAASVDYVIHLAARTAPSRDTSELEAQYRDTVLPTLNLAEALPPTLKLAVFVGSHDEYGNIELPFRESQLTCPASPYGWGKLTAFHGVRLLSQLRGFNFCWVRPSLAYGFGQRLGPFMPSVLNACVKNQSIDLSPCGQTRDLIHVDDVTEAFSAMLREHALLKNQVLNVSTGSPVTLKECAEKIQAFAGGGELRIGAIPYRPNETMHIYSDPSRWRELQAQFERPVREPLSLEAGLRKTIAQMKERR